MKATGSITAKSMHPMLWVRSLEERVPRRRRENKPLPVAELTKIETE